MGDSCSAKVVYRRKVEHLPKTDLYGEGRAAEGARAAPFEVMRVEIHAGEVGRVVQSMEICEQTRGIWCEQTMLDSTGHARSWCAAGDVWV